ncbi:hypothetical protein ABIB06_002134 [Bradyrhizobium sp. LB8.2]
MIYQTGENTVTIASLIQTSIAPDTLATSSAALNTASASDTSAATTSARPPSPLDLLLDLRESIRVACDQAYSPVRPGEAMNDRAPNPGARAGDDDNRGERFIEFGHQMCTLREVRTLPPNLESTLHQGS